MGFLLNIVRDARRPPSVPVGSAQRHTQTPVETGRSGEHEFDAQQEAFPAEATANSSQSMAAHDRPMAPNELPDARLHTHPVSQHAGANTADTLRANTKNFGNATPVGESNRVVEAVALPLTDSATDANNGSRLSGTGEIEGVTVDRAARASVHGVPAEPVSSGQRAMATRSAAFLPDANDAGVIAAVQLAQASSPNNAPELAIHEHSPARGFVVVDHHFPGVIEEGEVALVRMAEALTRNPTPDMAVAESKPAQEEIRPAHPFEFTSQTQPAEAMEREFYRQVPESSRVEIGRIDVVIVAVEERAAPQSVAGNRGSFDFSSRHYLRGV